MFVERRALTDDHQTDIRGLAVIGLPHFHCVAGPEGKRKWGLKNPNKDVDNREESQMRILRFGAVRALLMIGLTALAVSAYAEEPPGFGINVGKEISRGFVFWNGSYIEPPYVISRIGLALHINGVELEKSPPWPPYDYRVGEDPGMPDVTASSTWENMEDADDPRDVHWRRKLRYAYQTYGPEEARTVMIEYLRQLPFVASAEPESEASPVIVVREVSGRERLVDIGEIEIGPPLTKEEMIALVDQKKSHLEERLLKGDCYLFFGGGSYISFGESKAARILPDAITILRSGVTYEEKRVKLEELGILPRETDAFYELIDNFEASSSLDDRLEALAGRIE